MHLSKVFIPVVFIAIGIALGIQFGGIDIPSDFERPWLYRVMTSSFNFIGRVVSFLSKIIIQ